MTENNKIAVVIYEPVSGDMSRVYRGLKTAVEFKKAGDDVVVVFDGSGVESLAALSDASHPLNPILVALKDNVRGACAHCSKSHNVKDVLDGAGWTLLDQAAGEASIRDLVNEGRQVLNY
ncbi:DsrE family protein (plasmid) [Coraliomargarita sp. W4R53]